MDSQILVIINPVIEIMYLQGKVYQIAMLIIFLEDKSQIKVNTLLIIQEDLAHVKTLIVFEKIKLEVKKSQLNSMIEMLQEIKSNQVKEGQVNLNIN